MTLYNADNDRDHGGLCMKFSLVFPRVVMVSKIS